jgi:hypothetical protein
MSVVRRAIPLRTADSSCQKSISEGTTDPVESSVVREVFY